MLSRPLLLFCFFSLGFLSMGSAQDMLLTTDGQKLQVWVTEIGNTYVRYFPATPGGGEEIDLPKKEVAKISFESGEEQILNPMLPSAASRAPTKSTPALATASIPPTPPTSTERQGEVFFNDAVVLQNGETLWGKVTEINDTHIFVEVNGSDQVISQQNVRLIEYSNGYREYYDEAAAVSRQEIQEAPQQLPNSSVSAPKPVETIASSPAKSAISDARASYEAKKSRKNGPGHPVRWYAYAGISRNTGIGVGKKEQELLQERTERELEDFESLSVEGQVRAAWGLQAGGGLLYPVNQQVAVQAGLQLALKGYPIEQSITYARSDSGQTQQWDIQQREQQRLLQLDLPIGIEAQLLPALFVQAGGILGVSLRGWSQLETDTQVSGEGGQAIASLSGLTEQRSLLRGIGLAPGLYLGLGVPISQNIDINLRLQTHISSGHPEAFTQTLLQAGLRFHWE